MTYTITLRSTNVDMWHFIRPLFSEELPGPFLWGNWDKVLSAQPRNQTAWILTQDSTVVSTYVIIIIVRLWGFGGRLELKKLILVKFLGILFKKFPLKISSLKNFSIRVLLRPNDSHVLNSLQSSYYTKSQTLLYT